MAENQQIQRLFLDLETSPNVVFSWRVGRDINIDYENIVKERTIICIGWKWEHEKEVHCITWDNKQDDKPMLKQFVPILREADGVVNRYVERFRMKLHRARAARDQVLVGPYIKTIVT